MQIKIHAARTGRLLVLAWLLQEYGPDRLGLDEPLFTSAAGSGSVGLLAWLRERGCAWHADAWEAAAGAGCVEALEWLAERGCPMPEEGKPYAVACRNGDMSTARCLVRLGVPWGPPGGDCRCEVARIAPLPMLRWLLDAGCRLEPSDYTAAMAPIWPPWIPIPPTKRPEVLALLEQHARGGGGGLPPAE
ncbi:hypothetical protein GPECTOR_27g663 [Gonium pectorale]|uniref:Ankyrin repeat domain-containing protein n=1 Tax=Gonium pectorale TaxID=33097 RepID=A0A150GFD4_GONPE|nr:hypothetical protein GPECTOR_27g663 [Gonium pectorale]|eukprot:KXZ48493.1 hypothetical protein GPECTOR_27g663 [Gonium pectorale]